jgi:hypothetical protein
MDGGRRVWRALTVAGSVGSVALTAHTVARLRALRVPPLAPPQVTERVSVLLPVSDDTSQVGDCLTAILDQIAVPDLEILVLDDGSNDGTADVVRAAAGDDPRVRLLTATPPPPGWLNRPHACAQLAATATGSILVFIDATVRLAPQAIAASVAVLRDTGLDLVSPHPRQVTESLPERLVQPLLQWSWLTTLPLHRSERLPWPSLSATNGQLLVMDAETYRRCGGHTASRDTVLDDRELLRAVKRSGGRGGVVDGTGLAVCRLYTDWPSLRAGCTKSLWAAFGSPSRAAAVGSALCVLYVVPPLAALGGSSTGLVGYLAAVAGRYLVAERTGGRSIPDAFFHPASVLTLVWLTAASWRARRLGALAGRGRRLCLGPASGATVVGWITMTTSRRVNKALRACR